MFSGKRTSGKRLAVILFVLAQFFLASSLLAQIPPHTSPLKQSCPCATDGRCKPRPKSKPRERSSRLRNSFRRDGTTATVPTTVVAALVKDKTFPDPLSGMKLRDLPGMNYPIGANFSNIPMAPDSPYAVSWWYRKQFAAPASYKGKTVWLKFNGINYRANIWLNGKQIAKSDDVAGAWRTYEFNVTDAAKPGAENVLAVQVFSPTDHDLAITFVDWNPAPPDKNMGLWREVYLTTSGPVALRYPTVVSKLNPPANDAAQLTVTAQLKNGTDKALKRQAERPDRNRQVRARCRTRCQRIERRHLHA